MSARAFAVLTTVALVVLSACTPSAELEAEPTVSDGAVAAPVSPTQPSLAPSPIPTAPVTDAPSAQPSIPEPTSPPTPSSTTAEPAEPDEAPGTRIVTAYYVRPGGGTLWVEPERRRLDEPTRAVAGAALRELLESAPREPGLVPAVPEPVEVLDVALRGRTLVANLDRSIRRPALGGGAEQALQQAIAHTGAQYPTVDRVQVLLDGRRVESVWGHAPWSEALEPDLFALSPVDLTRPAPGATVEPGRLTVAGTANTFEATVELLLRNPDGEVVERTFATASCGTGCRGRFRHTFDTPLDRPGMWTIVASEPDPSGGEGGSPFVTRRQVQVVR